MSFCHCGLLVMLLGCQSLLDTVQSILMLLAVKMMPGTGS
jgi:hypothetical protein